MHAESHVCISHQCSQSRHKQADSITDVITVVTVWICSGHWQNPGAGHGRIFKIQMGKLARGHGHGLDKKKRTQFTYILTLKDSCSLDRYLFSKKCLGHVLLLLKEWLWGLWLSRPNKPAHPKIISVLSFHINERIITTRLTVSTHSSGDLLIKPVVPCYVLKVSLVSR